MLSSVVLNSLLAVGIVLVPTTVLLAIIAGRLVQFDDGAVLVDVSLGTILVFSSLAAVIIPFVYRNHHPVLMTDCRPRKCFGSDNAREIMDCSIRTDFLQCSDTAPEHTSIPSRSRESRHTGSPRAIQIATILLP